MVLRDIREGAMRRIGVELHAPAEEGVGPDGAAD